jgi:hypothetical protein
MEIAGDEISNVIQGLDIALLFAHYVGHMPAPIWMAFFSSGVFKPDFNDKRMRDLFVYDLTFGLIRWVNISRGSVPYSML